MKRGDTSNTNLRQVTAAGNRVKEYRCVAGLKTSEVLSLQVMTRRLPLTLDLKAFQPRRIERQMLNYR